MPWTGLLIVLSSKSLTVTVDSSAAPAVPMMMLHGGELAGNATLNEQERYAWEREWGLGRDHIGRQAHIDRQVYRRCASSDNGGWLTPWEWCEEHAGFERQTSTNAGSPWLLGVLLTAVVLAYATAASTISSICCCGCRSICVCSVLVVGIVCLVVLGILGVCSEYCGMVGLVDCTLDPS